MHHAYAEWIKEQICGGSFRDGWQARKELYQQKEKRHAYAEWIKEQICGGSFRDGWQARKELYQQKEKR